MTALRKIAGAVLVSLPFALITGFTIHEHGFAAAVVIWSLVAAITITIALGTWLLEG